MDQFVAEANEQASGDIIEGLVDGGETSAEG